MMAGSKIFIGKVTLENFLIFIFTFIVTVIVANAIYALTRRFLDDKFSQRNSKLIARVIQYGIFILGLYYGIYHVPHLDLTALVASLGIIGIAVAFSSQQIIQNFIAGILISIGRPIELEDWVEIAGPIQTGISKVKDITLTRTILRDIDGKLLYVPNFTLLSSKIINYTKSGFVEVPVQLTIPYDSDYEKVKGIIREVANNNVRILPNVPREERSIIVKLFELSRTKRLFDDKSDISKFEPRILISDISGSNITLVIRIWIREINKKEEIVSEFLDSLLEKLKGKDVDQDQQKIKALETNQGNDEVYYNRGVDYYKKGMYEQAILDFNNTLGINPGHAEAYFYKAVAFEKVGCLNEAREAYRGFIKNASPQYARYIKRAQERIRELEQKQ